MREPIFEPGRAQTSWVGPKICENTPIDIGKSSEAMVIAFDWSLGTKNFPLNNNNNNNNNKKKKNNSDYS